MSRQTKLGAYSGEPKSEEEGRAVRILAWGLLIIFGTFYVWWMVG